LYLKEKMNSFTSGKIRSQDCFHTAVTILVVGVGRGGEGEGEGRF